MEVKRISIREAKKRIKEDPEFSKMLIKSGWKEIALDLDGDGIPDVSFSNQKLGFKIDTIAVDLSGAGEYNLYIHDYDGNGVPDTVIWMPDGTEEGSVVAFGSDVELGFVNIGVKVANLLTAENFLNEELGLSLLDLAEYLKLNAAKMLAEIEKRQSATGIEKVYYFLDTARTYYLATVDGDKPRVRPFGTALLHDGKLYIQAGKGKDVVSQIAANPFVEICAFMNGAWLRVSGELVEDNSLDVKTELLDKMPELKNMYNAEDDSMEMFYFKNATATFSSFSEDPEVIEF